MHTVSCRSHSLLIGLLSIAGMLGNGCLPDREPTAPVEIDRPSTRSITPAEATLVVSRNTMVTMRFTERMDPNTFPGHFDLLDQAGTAVAGGFRAADTTVIFTPTQPLQKAVRYHAVLKGRVRDANRTSIQVNGEPVLDDTSTVMTTWFYTEGDYSTGGFHRIFVRDRKGGSVQFWDRLDSLIGGAAGFGAPEGMVLSPDGAKVFVSMTTRDSVAVADARTGIVEKRIPVASYPSSMAAQGNFVYVICINARQIAKINTATQSVEASFSLTFFPGKLAVSLDGQSLYTIDQQNRDLVLLRTSNGTVIKRLAGAVTQVVLGELVVHPTTGVVYVCNSKGLDIKTTDAAGTAFQVLKSYPAGTEPVQIAFDASAFYVAAGKSIFKYDAATGAPAGTLTFASTVKAVGSIPTGEVIYAAYGLSFLVIDARTLTILREIPVTSSGIEAIVAGPNKF